MFLCLSVASLVANCSVIISAIFERWKEVSCAHFDARFDSHFGAHFDTHFNAYFKIHFYTCLNARLYDNFGALIFAMKKIKFCLFSGGQLYVCVLCQSLLQPTLHWITHTTKWVTFSVITEKVSIYRDLAPKMHYIHHAQASTGSIIGIFT